MPQPGAESLAEARARSAAAGLQPDDMTWLDRLGWDDAAVPAIASDGEFERFRRIERMLNAAVAHLTFPERAESPEGRLAAALGARAADWTDRDED